YLMEVQREISYEKNLKKIGKTIKVLIDKKEGDYYIGRTQYDSYEVDNEVIIEESAELEIGRFYNVNITGAEEFELIGKIIS
ncbi:MAG TPA: TRAM domain-containing protein, partial [Saprospiraceae bacterium]|nr:TRAM domain-containing protein [Saprospiraceae bacterium]